MSNPSVSKNQPTKSDKAVDFLCLLGPGRPLASIDPDSGAFVVSTPQTPEEARNWIAARQGKLNQYYTVNPTRRPMNRKPAESDIAEVQYFHVEADPKPGELAADARPRLRAEFEAFDPPPTIIYDSGNGVVALWKLTEPIPLTAPAKVDECKAVNRSIAEALGGKAEGFDTCYSVEHLLRLPHTTNLPDARKRKAGRKIEEAGNVEHFPDRTYSEFDFPTVESPSIVPDDVDIGAPVTIDDVDELPTSRRVKEIIKHGRVEGEVKERDDSRSAWRWEAMCQLFRDGIGLDVIHGLLVDNRYAISDRALETANPEQYAREEIKRLRKKVTTAADDFDAVEGDAATGRYAVLDEWQWISDSMQFVHRDGNERLNEKQFRMKYGYLCRKKMWCKRLNAATCRSRNLRRKSISRKRRSR